MIKRARFKLFSNCILVEGAKRSTICDLQRNEVHFVPNSFVSAHKSQAIYTDTVLSDEMSMCVAYLAENDLGHFIEDEEVFPDLDLKYEFPGHASHAIVEISKRSDYNYLNVFSSLSDVGVKFVELWISEYIEPNVLCLILDSLKTTRIINVTLYLKFSDYWTNSKVTELFINYQRISFITLFASFKDSIENILGHKFIHAQGELGSKQCGKIHSNCFSCNIKTFSESQRFNTCLNGKVSITDDGFIKNCPSLNETFGNISDNMLDKTVRSVSFQKLWRINKDTIDVCKDCEFRHVCTDCRAFLEDPNNLYSKPLKCGYDPYTTRWEEWSTNPLKQAAIQHYNL
jgi:SPASM domain peptide maturase of grasp-with-spasm system